VGKRRGSFLLEPVGGDVKQGERGIHQGAGLEQAGVDILTEWKNTRGPKEKSRKKTSTQRLVEKREGIFPKKGGNPGLAKKNLFTPGKSPQWWGETEPLCYLDESR